MVKIFNFVPIMLSLIFLFLLMLLYKKMMSHPTGIVIDGVGIKIGGIGCLCKEHEICCSVLRNDMVVCLQKVLFLAAHVLITIA